MVKYKYDAWGKCVVDASTTNTTLANLNPFRYRGYYLISGTGAGMRWLIDKLIPEL